MSNIQRVSETNVHFRSYQYDWESRTVSSDAQKTGGMAVYSYNFHGISQVSLAKLIMLVSLQESTVYEQLLVTALEDLQTNSEILETATLIADKLAAMVEASAGSVLFMGDTVPYLPPNSTTVIQVEMRVFLVVYLGISTSDLPSNVNWHTADCEKGLGLLLDVIDGLNKLSETKAVNMQTYVNQLTLANNFGVNMDKLILHGCRNLAGNIGK